MNRPHINGLFLKENEFLRKNSLRTIPILLNKLLVEKKYDDVVDIFFKIIDLHKSGEIKNVDSQLSSIIKKDAIEIVTDALFKKVFLK